MCQEIWKSIRTSTSLTQDVCYEEQTSDLATVGWTPCLGGPGHLVRDKRRKIVSNNQARPPLGRSPVVSGKIPSYHPGLTSTTPMLTTYISTLLNYQSTKLNQNIALSPKSQLGLVLEFDIAHSRFSF